MVLHGNVCYLEVDLGTMKSNSSMEIKNTSKKEGSMEISLSSIKENGTYVT